VKTLFASWPVDEAGLVETLTERIGTARYERSARAASGHPAAVPPRSVTNSRRLMPTPPRGRYSSYSKE
jgi:hypothetical protein